jgi:hypothetical protein
MSGTAARNSGNVPQVTAQEKKTSQNKLDRQLILAVQDSMDDSVCIAAGDGQCVG